MATKRVAEQHEDWLSLADPEAPWFSLPVLKRAFPNGLDPTPSEIRAEHKARWYGGDAVPAVRSADDRTEHADWLLRGVLGWGSDYVSGPDLPGKLASGVTRHEVTVVPTGVYRPQASAPVGVFEEPRSDEADEPARHRVLVFVLPAGTDPGARPIGDAWPATWVQRAALACRHFEVPLALVTDGDHLTLVHAPGGGATGWGSWRASEFATEPVLFDSFRSMLHARRFLAVVDKDTPEQLLTESAGTQAEVTDQLGAQVRKATELLVNAISRADSDRGGALLAGVAPDEVYEAAVTVMMRTVFLLVAEENDLLPVDNPDYQQLYAIRTLRESLLQRRFENPEVLETRTTAWHRLLATSRAVHSGVYHETLSVPAYGGDLFDPDRFPFLEGRTVDGTWRTRTGAPIPVTDLDVLAILDALLVLRFRGAGGITDTRRLSYRHVDVEQIGHIYERLLDHGAVRAGEVVLGLNGRRDQEPEVVLSALEAKRIDGEKALVAYLSNKAAMDAGRYVGTVNQVRKLLAQPVEGHLRAGLIQACQGDQVLAKRLEPFANLLRLDLRDRPMVFLPGAIYVTETGSRRDSGTAYTTKELADEVAEHALAPLVYSPGPQDTLDTNEWRIRPSAEILGLKVCDPAVGSGAILVAACRYLAERLIEAWRVEGDPRAADLATAADDPNRLDVVVEARRLVAEHCCYGVDRNPMAVEMAKLSMWLTTVARDRPFTFLDHALKAGDSLLGIWDLDQLRYLHYDVQAGRDRTVPIADWKAGGDAMFAVERLIGEALDLRHEVQSIDTRSPADIERKQKLHAESEARLEVLAAIADVVTGAAISTSGERDPVAALTQRMDVDAEVIGELIAELGRPGEPMAVDSVRARAGMRLDAGQPGVAPRRRPLHWPIAFPEVFASGIRRFDVLIGNPPFVTGTSIKGVAGVDYLKHISAWLARGHTAGGRADLVCYFFLMALDLGKALGLIATNSVAQGDSAEVALRRLIDEGWKLYRAKSSEKWPGSDSVQVAKIWATSSTWDGPYVLDDVNVDGIDENLYPEPRSGWRKAQLRANSGICVNGSMLHAQGFILTESQAARLIELDPRSREVITPLVNGDELNDSPGLTSNRWTINYRKIGEGAARRYPECFEFLLERVPHEIEAKGGSYAGWKNWWQYWRPRAELYDVIWRFDEVLAIAATSKVLVPIFAPARQTFTHACYVFTRNDLHFAGSLWSSHHWRWAVRHASSMREDPRYVATDVFNTFPLPPEDDGCLANAASALADHRRAYMNEKRCGVRQVYSAFHDESCTSREIGKLRALHIDLDHAAQAAYGWDFELRHGFHAVRGQAGTRFSLDSSSAVEMLERLLELNKERYEAEVAAGLHATSKAASRRAAAANQPSLLGDYE